MCKLAREGAMRDAAIHAAVIVLRKAGAVVAAA